MAPVTGPAYGADPTPASDRCQRWRNGRHSWRHRSEGGFDSSRYEVAEITEADARDFVVRHHYSRSYPAAVRRYGLFHRDELCGAVVLGSPMQERVLTNVFPHLEPYDQSLELARLVLLDAVPANAESARNCVRCNTGGGLLGRPAVSVTLRAGERERQTPDTTRRPT